MKNLFIGLGVLAMIGATSCKKIHTCECSAGSVTIANETEEKMTKKEAKEECEKGSGLGIVCELK